MDKINAMTLCHIGTEFVVIAGVSFWLNRRISSLEEQINIQNDTISKYEAMINQQGQMLMRHEQIIRQMTGAPPLSGPPGQDAPSPEKARPPGRPKSGQPINHGEHQYPRSQQPQTPVHNIVTHSEFELQNQMEESDISDTELDKLIGDEIDILKGSENPKKNTAEDHIELLCGEDDCDLKNHEMEIKIKKRRRGKGKRVIRT